MYIIKERIGHNLKQKYDQFNKEFFDNTLIPIPVMFKVLRKNGIAGWFWWVNGKSDRIEINTDLEVQSEQLLDGVLLHEMIHQWIFENGLSNSQMHNKAFRNKVDIVNKQSNNKYKIGYTEISAATDQDNLETKKIYALFCLYDKALGKDNLATPVQLFDEDRYNKHYIYQCLRNMNVEARLLSHKIRNIYVVEVSINNNFITEKSIAHRLNVIYTNSEFSDTFDNNFLKLMKQSKSYKIVNSYELSKRSFVPELK